VEQPDKKPGLLGALWRALVGPPKDISEPRRLFHRMSLIPILAWVGLGADGLSSSAYGPEEAFRALGSHTYLGLLLAAAIALTVGIISYSYSRIIEQFPHGGGGYIVATHLLGRRPGHLESALWSYGDHHHLHRLLRRRLFSYLPVHYHYKVPFACTLIVILILLNIRGVKESVVVLAPIFVVFTATHLLMLLYGVITHADRVTPVWNNFEAGFRHDLSTIGLLGIALIFLRAFSLGGGTYTGIEAVSNGLPIMREPRVQTGKRTMLYMAISLAFTASLLLLCYLVLALKPVEGKTLNAVLADTLFADWPMGRALASITIFSEGALLLVAAQAGFVDGPRVMAYMANDFWFPRRFAALSERLSMRNGVLLMGVAAIAILFYTKGSVSALVIMYAINVFLTFSLSQLGMMRLFAGRRREDPIWLRRLSVHLVAFILCATILVITIFEKFTEGGWMTLVITAVVIAICYLIRRHYLKVQQAFSQLDESLLHLPTTGPPNTARPELNAPTAIQLVSGYSGFGIHTLLSILTTFPNMYKNIIFVSVAVIDSGAFKGAREVEALERSVKQSLEKYVDLARRLGFAADYRMAVATEVVESAVAQCKALREEFPHSTVFTGQLTFELEKFYHRMLHNETAFAIQRHLHWDGITSVILPIRVQFKRK
jgi:amino acid transporter